MELDKPTAPTTLSPPAAPLNLNPPAEVAVVEPEQADGMIAIAPDRRATLRAMAVAEAESYAQLAPNSPEMTAKADELADTGRDEIMKAGNASNAMLQRPAAALMGNKGQNVSPQGQVSKTLGDLRRTVEELSPAGADLGKKKKLLGFIPFGKQIDKYFDKYRSAQSELDAITKALVAGQDALRKDNAAIEEERRSLYAVMEKLTEWGVVLQEIDNAVEAKRQQLENTNPALAADFQGKLLFAIRQRRQDILTQLAVSAQGYLAMDMVAQNNKELIRGVDRARSTTMSALRTAIIVSQALSNQKLVLEQIQGLNATTSELIQANAAMLRQQGTEIQKQAVDSTIELGKLQKAFDDTFAAMDELDAFRANAADSMQATVNTLETQIERAKPYLARSTRVQ